MFLTCPAGMHDNGSQACVSNEMPSGPRQKYLGHSDKFTGEIEAPDGTHPRIDIDKFVDLKTGLPRTKVSQADRDNAYDKLTIKEARYEAIVSFTDKTGRTHSFRCKYTEDDLIPGVTNAKEADQISHWLLKNIEKQAVLVGLSTYDPSFLVQFLGMGDNDHDIRLVSTTRQGLNHLMGMRDEDIDALKGKSPYQRAAAGERLARIEETLGHFPLRQTQVTTCLYESGSKDENDCNDKVGQARQQAGGNADCQLNVSHHKDGKITLQTLICEN